MPLGSPQLVHPRMQVRGLDGNKTVAREREILPMAGSGMLIQALPRGENVGVITQPTGTGHVLGLGRIDFTPPPTQLMAASSTPLLRKGINSPPASPTGFLLAVAEMGSATGAPVDWVATAGESPTSDAEEDDSVSEGSTSDSAGRFRGMSTNSFEQQRSCKSKTTR